MHEAGADERTDARPAAGEEAPGRRHDARMLTLPLPFKGMEAAQGRHAGSQPPQLGQEQRPAPAGEQGAGGYIGLSMGGTSRVSFRATGTEQGEKIPLGSFLTAEAAAPAYDRWAAATPGHALSFLAGCGRGSAPAPRQLAALATRPGAHVHGLQQEQNDDDNYDKPEVLIVTDGQLTDFDSSDRDDDGHGPTSVDRTARDHAQRKAPAAGIARGSKADYAQYVGVHFDERKKAAPFYARIYFKLKNHYICYCPTADVAARAYDAVERLIPGRKLNFPTMSPAAASNSPQRAGASAAVPAESDILAAIAAVRHANRSRHQRVLPSTSGQHQQAQHTQPRPVPGFHSSGSM
jgi:hypothetical protein